MRIISDFHDYYDCMLTPGVTEPLWLRKQTETTLKQYRYPDGGWWLNDARFSMKTGIVGFCGKVEAFVEYGHYTVTRWTYYRRWSADDCINLLRERNGEKWYNMWRRRKWGVLKDTARFFEKVKDAKFDTLFEQSPIWLLRGKPSMTLTINPELRDIEYQRRVPPPQAYQELAKWHGNLAHPEKPLPKVSDEDLLSAKGFDKYSFRKDKKCT